MSNNCENRYKLRREIAVMTQEQAAEALQISVRSLSDYETGKTVPPDEVVDRMADVYHSHMLGYEHVKETNILGKHLPDIVMPENNGDMAFQLSISSDEISSVYKSLKKIFANKKVDEHEWSEYIANVETTEIVAGKLLSAAAFGRQYIKDRKPVDVGGEQSGCES